ncbi:MAG: metallopeptidase family protein [Phycisphaerales bacterium]
MKPALRERFDRLLEDAIEALPERFRQALDEIQVIVEDAPGKELVKGLARDGVVESEEDDDLMGLHSGLPLVEGGVDESGRLPTQIHLFREPIVEHAGGWDQDQADEEIYEEVRITLLHEIGHHFGLDEDDLERLGYA